MRDRSTLFLIIALVVLVVCACVFVPGFYGAIMESLRCMNPNIQCVRVIGG